uniref:Calpain catalytic domain-containing protein n=1 Tax=Chromera velia CCMP2878 TaxID=1169474 RepID=A0A0G4GWA9_9ALVE|eukprot:Cvel_23681.t1-p1 / transcript=Cvel_23681.t1 / gene=Cvel_23681 / organism=Chromera_velia_CCMP2878 / gene_product=Calpain-D, putative / transcript_product=Calpain-D, putative / location=Cvel_scaffold2469:203-3911(-) / protein_length=458 / sequence_SO=supercontig / SO=protein_coding / is_pseudo=false
MGCGGSTSKKNLPENPSAVPPPPLPPSRDRPDDDGDDMESEDELPEPDEMEEEEEPCTDTHQTEQMVHGYTTDLPLLIEEPPVYAEQDHPRFAPLLDVVLQKANLSSATDINELKVPNDHITKHGGGPKLTVKVTNYTGKEGHMNWVSYKGEVRKSKAGLNPTNGGGSKTWKGHTYQVTVGDEVFRFAVQEGKTNLRIGSPDTRVKERFLEQTLKDWRGGGTAGWCMDSSIDMLSGLFEAEGPCDKADTKFFGTFRDTTENREKIMNALENLKTGGKKFADPFFNPLNGVDRPGVERASEAGNSLLFSDDIAFNDSFQGNIGNCYMLQCMVSIAARYPESIREAFVSGDALHSSGAVLISLFSHELGEWRLVLIDDFLPKPYFGSRPSGKDKNEYWQPLLEKAFAKLQGSYPGIVANRGQWGITSVTRALRGPGPLEILKVPKDEEGSAAAFDEMAER